MISGQGFRTRFSEPEGEEGVVSSAASAPLSPFRPDGTCRACGGFAEHFASCAHATWERRVL